jgi:hypothetical protein
MVRFCLASGRGGAQQSRAVPCRTLDDQPIVESIEHAGGTPPAVTAHPVHASSSSDPIRLGWGLPDKRAPLSTHSLFLRLCLLLSIRLPLPPAPRRCLALLTPLRDSTPRLRLPSPTRPPPRDQDLRQAPAPKRSRRHQGSNPPAPSALLHCTIIAQP